MTMNGTARIQSRAANDAGSTLGLLRALAVAGALTLAAAAGLAGQDTQPKPTQVENHVERVARDTPIQLDVANYNWLDMRVYAVRAGIRHRLGTVTSYTQESFTLPTHLQADIVGVQILAVPIGSNRAHLTQELLANPGDVIALTLEADLDLSSLYVAR